MKLSVVIPAFNEAKRIEDCLKHLRAALEANTRPGFEFEIIVVDNNSTDRTADLARRMGAEVVFEPINQISRARNAGAAAAVGSWFLFLDADTLVSSGTIAELLTAIGSKDCVGGGTMMRFDKPDIIAHAFLAVTNPIIRWLKLTPGCFIFCQADAFRAIGGFSLEMFAGEDPDFGWRLKRWAKGRHLRMVMLHAHPPITSSRKVELYGWGELCGLMLRWLFMRRRTTHDKRYLRIFYDGRR